MVKREMWRRRRRWEGVVEVARSRRGVRGWRRLWGAQEVEVCVGGRSVVCVGL